MIPFEDGSALAERAITFLLGQKESLGLPKMEIERLPAFLQSARRRTLTRGQRLKICNQAVLIIEQFYAHLPFKRARYAIDPVQRIRLLRARLDHITHDLEFHSELLEAFSDMRDVHTSYRLPPPYSNAIAFLPFFLQTFFDKKKQRRLVVTNVLFKHASFKPGVEVIQWNGLPVQRAIELLAEHIPGGNPAAKIIRGLMRMTVRSLASTPPPDEEVVFVRYRQPDAGAAERIIELPWYAGTGLGTDLFQVNGTAICEPVKELAIVRKVLWSRQEWRLEKDSKSQEGLPQHSTQSTSKLPEVFQFQHSDGRWNDVHSPIGPALLMRAGKRFGYVRIKSFEGDPDAIFEEFKRILTVMRLSAPDGLILDVRGNAGGEISAAERLLQLITPAQITPAQFHFANTPTIQNFIARLRELFMNRLDNVSLLEQIDDAAPYFSDWFSDTLETVASGSLLTIGRPLTSPESANDTGQMYYGPVVLVIDALSYSATDSFAAGFQDHGIGNIIGVDENTGGGGGSRWLHNEELVPRLKGILQSQPQLEALPAGASMSIALQRSTRVGPNAGSPVEDVGVKCTIPYRLTRQDVTENNRRLISFACRILAKKPVYQLDIIHLKRTGATLYVKVRSAQIDFLICFLDGYPQRMNAARGTQSFQVQLPKSAPSAPREFRIEGHSWRPIPGSRRKALTLVAAAKLKIPRG
jgi:peptidase S41-like protein